VSHDDPEPSRPPSETEARDDAAGGDSACWLHQVCDGCGAIVDAQNGHREGCPEGR
jgi:hypothetical protein